MISDPALAGAILERLHVRTANALTHVVSDLVNEGVITPGARLPTARDLAESAKVSKSMVGQAWKALSEEGIVETRGRSGTYVVGPPRPALARRYASMFRASAQSPIDLANIRGETLPRPSLPPALQYAASFPPTRLAFPDRICEPLATTAQAIWPYPAESFLVAHGGPDGLCLYLQTNVRRGDRILVETPTYPRILDVVERAGGIPVPIPWRESGPDLQALHRACGSHPALFVYQPTCSQPYGASVTEDWADAAATILSRLKIQVLVATMVPLLDPRQPTLGTRMPDRVTRVQSYALWFSADIRASLVGGPGSVLDALWSELTFSTRYVSPVLQRALHHLLTDPAAVADTDACIRESRRRVVEFRAALRRVGFSLTERVGSSIWLPVPDEVKTVRRTADRGVTVFPGSLCLTEPARSGEPQFVHVSATNLSEGFDDMAQLLSEAALGS